MFDSYRSSRIFPFDDTRLLKSLFFVLGAKASANLYSLIETTKANDLEPYNYLRHVFTELPRAKTLEHIEALLPYNFKRAQLNPGHR